MNADAHAARATEDALLATVAYSDVFDMPLPIDDLCRFIIGTAASPTDISAAVDRMAHAGRLARHGDLVYLPGRSEVLAVNADRRCRAASMWRDAECWGRRIGRLPFVRMVAVTGGLAVDSVAAHDDIDYFILTRPGRLWLTRLMIVALARLAARQGVELCPNYIVSERAIELTDRNVYVARELAQMVAIVDADRCADLRRRNDWLFAFLPNATAAGDVTHAGPAPRSRAKSAAEWLLLRSPFGAIERWEMNRKIARLTETSSRRADVGAPDESSFSADVCKGHMVGNAAGIDAAWTARLAVLVGDGTG